MRNRSAIFDRFDVQTGGLKRRDGTFPTTTGAFDFDVNFTDTKLLGLLGGLLSRTLTSKRRAFTASFESARSGTGPAQGFPLGVRNGHRCVIEGCLNVSYAVGNITSDAFLLGFCHF